MSTKYEYNNTETIGYGVVAGDTWYYQTFTPQITHYLNMVKLFLFTHTEGPDTDVMVDIRNTTDNHPDGTILTSVIFDRAELTEDEASEWKEIELPKYRVIKDTTYAIVLRMPDAVGYEVVNWWVSAGGYSRGSVGASYNAGVTWEMDTESDALFEEWGDPVVSHRHHPTIPTEPNRGKVLSEMGSLR